ncbi:hypothetical protein EGY19_26095 [Burkholderia multivorans]|nr:hypothetical protein EGY19_26095 [Burkholderia multivorans]PRF50862.1 hypothetical protein C6Q04_00670 [Burkholderia multivorans]PRG51539.1 hypothetical protein C6T63_16675 [Burkholderia multivorans]
MPRIAPDTESPIATLLSPGSPDADQYDNANKKSTADRTRSAPRPSTNRFKASEYKAASSLPTAYR